MQHLRNVLDGKSTDKLDRRQLGDIVRTTNSYTTWSERAKATLYISEALKKDKIQADDLLVASIPEVRAVSDIILVSLAFRAGANRNLYVMTPEIGSAHVMVYAVTSMKAKETDIKAIILILYVLMIMGSQSVSNAFDQSRLDQSGLQVGDDVQDRALLDCVVKTLGSGAVSVTSVMGPGPRASSPRPMSVQDWLTSQGLETPTNLDRLRAESPQMVATIGTICDIPELAYARIADVEPGPPRGDLASPRDLTPLQTAQRLSGSGVIIPSLKVACAARATKILQEYTINSGLRVSHVDHGMYVGLTETIELYNLEAMVRFLELGQTATYFTINLLVLNLRKAGLDSDLTLISLYQAMLMECVSRGAELDVEQMAVISMTSSPIAQAILQIHSQPMWLKACAVPSGPVTDGLKSLGFNLGLDYTVSKPELCAQLRRFAEADPVALKESAVLRQKIRVGTGVSTISEFVGGTVPSVQCENKTALQRDPFAYNDATMMFYRDHDDLVWCFTSDTFESLIANPVNPHKPTADPLPKTFIDELKVRLDLMRRLGIPVSTPVSTAEAIDSLAKRDEVSTRDSDFIVTTIEQSGRLAGIELGTIRRLSREQMHQILAMINMDQPMMEMMTDRHRLITFSRAAYTVIKYQPAMATTFFAGLSAQARLIPVRRVVDCEVVG